LIQAAKQSGITIASLLQLLRFLKVLVGGRKYLTMLYLVPARLNTFLSTTSYFYLQEEKQTKRKI